MPGEHSKRHPPSSAEIWMNCPASVHVTKDMTGYVSSTAAEGTACHMMIENALMFNLPQVSPPEAFDIDGEQVEVTPELVEMADLALSYVWKMTAEKGKDALYTGTEWKADLTYIEPDFFGSVDRWILGLDGVLDVIDYKFGRVDVSPVGNLQMLIYVTGILHYLKGELNATVKRIKLHVIQPRSLEPGPIFKVAEYTVEALEAFEKTLIERVAMTNSDNPAFLAGPWCQYCPALGACSATMDTMRNMGILLSQEIKEIPLEKLAYMLECSKFLAQQMKTVKNVAKDRLSRGLDVPGAWLVHARAHRRWKEEKDVRDKVFRTYGLDAFKTPTPSQVEQLGLGGQEVTKDHAFSPIGQRAIAHSKGDRRTKYVNQRTAAEILKEN